MKIKLVELSLNNFQGGTFDLDTGGENINIFADNATGKTRLFSAFCWLLFNKDSLGRADFDIKDSNAEHGTSQGVNHSVEGFLAIDDKEIALRKEYREIWAKKRGTSERTMTGNTTDHFINDVKVPKKDYDAKIAEIVGDEAVFQLITSPTAFPALHWEKQRAMLLKVCGDISDDEIIASDKELLPLVELLKKYEDRDNPFKDMRAENASRRSAINKQIEELPVKINENERMMPSVEGLNEALLSSKIIETETAINVKKLELQGVNTGGRIAELSKELNIARADISKLETIWQDTRLKKAKVINDQIKDKQADSQRVRDRIKDINESLSAKKRRISDIETELDKLRGQWSDTDNRDFVFEGATSCAACGQNLPVDKVQAARDKAEGIFNNEKAESLASTVLKSDSIKEEKKALREATTKLEAEKPSFAEAEPDMSASISARDFRRESATDYSNIPGREKLLDRMGDINSEIEAEKRGVSADVEKRAREISALESALKEAKANVDKFVKREDGEKRIEELKASEKKLASEYEKLEHQLYIMEKFTKVQVGMLDEKINSKFEIARFKLFNVLVNGGVEPCCEIMKDGVGYNSGLNSGGRIQAGADIVRTLQAHYDLYPVIFIDNRETVSVIPEMKCQTINLYKEEKDKTLRIEKEN